MGRIITLLVLRLKNGERRKRPLKHLLIFDKIFSASLKLRRLENLIFFPYERNITDTFKHETMLACQVMELSGNSDTTGCRGSSRLNLSVLDAKYARLGWAQGSMFRAKNTFLFRNALSEGISPSTLTIWPHLHISPIPIVSSTVVDVQIRRGGKVVEEEKVTEELISTLIPLSH